ncbi:SphA family protein [Cupriavidus oxalaticus]|uniref:Transporter n=1 Tax=Cupriavidus oxalaticus TaxID=96344 RepID=A0A4P7L8L4_9BURK|nr:transporter [Cupriavidus oxalaticus]QBY51938.1 transporter [Cupriavidus oxalaticus]
MPTKTARRLLATLAPALPLLGAATSAGATEGALGRPVTGTSVTPNAGIVSPEPILAVNLGEIYLDGSVGGSRSVPIGGKAALDVDGKVAFTLATVMKVWDTGPGAWNFASSFTLPYVWTKVTANAGIGGVSASTQDTASNLFDIYFTPLIAGYHFSKTEHVALSLNIWAPTGKYDPNALANPSLNNWTFIPQVAYTRLFPEHGLEFDAVAGLQFYTRNNATDYQNAPLFTLDTMLLKRFANGAGVGLIAGTTQQLGDDSGPLADRLNGFRGHDWALGPIVTYDTKIGAKSHLSMSLRWVPTIASKNRLDSTSTFMGTAAIVF